MTKSLPKWIMNRFAILWTELGEKEFQYNKAVEILKEEKKELTSIILSELKKNGWIELKINPKDSRKRIYKLKSPNQAVIEIAKKQPLDKKKIDDFEEMF